MASLRLRATRARSRQSGSPASAATAQAATNACDCGDVCWPVAPDSPAAAVEAPDAELAEADASDAAFGDEGRRCSPATAGAFFGCFFSLAFSFSFSLGTFLSFDLAAARARVARLTGSLAGIGFRRPSSKGCTVLC